MDSTKTNKLKVINPGSTDAEDINIPAVKPGTTGNDNIENVTDQERSLTKTNGTEASPYLINALAGNDTVTNQGNYVIISAAAGNDTVINSGANATISLGAGNDSVYNSGASAIVYGESGNNTITNNVSGSEVVTILGGTGIDVVSLQAGSAMVSLGASADRVSIDSSNANAVTVIGGAGNDSIWASSRTAADVYEYNRGDGDDVIVGFNAANNILKLNTNSYISSIQAGSDDSHIDFIVSISGGGKVTLKDLASTTTTVKIWTPANGTFDASDVSAVPVPNSIVTVDASGTATGANNKLINGSTSNDTLVISGNNAYIYGNAGNDTIKSNGTGAVIWGGGGNDTITSTSNTTTGNTFIYGNADGNDSIIGFAENDTIKIISGTMYALDNTSYINGTSSGDLRLRIGNSYVTLNSFWQTNNQFTVINSDTTTATIVVPAVVMGSSANNTVDPATTDTATATLSALVNTNANAVIYGLGGQDSIVNSGATTSIYGGDGNDTISNTGNTSYIDGGNGNDSISNAGSGTSVNIMTITGGNNDDTITNTSDGSYVQIIGDAGNDSISNSAVNVTIEGGAGNDTIINDAAGVTINGGAGNDKFLLNDPSGDSAVTVFAGAGNDSIYTYASTLGDGNSDKSHVYVFDSVSGNNYIDNFKKGKDKIYITIPDGWANNNSVTGNASLSPYGYVLKIGTSSYVTLNGVGTDTDITTSIYINGVQQTTEHKFESGDTIVGTTGNDTIDNTTIGAGIIDGGNGNDYINNTNKQSASISGGAGNDTIINSGASATIYGGYGTDYITNSGANVLIDSGDSNDYIRNSGHDVKIESGNGNDYITLGSGSSNVTVEAGTGNDIISLAAGVVNNTNFLVFGDADNRDSIYGYNASTKIVANITGTAVVSGGGTQNLVATINGSAAHTITFVDYQGSLTTVSPNASSPDALDEETAARFEAKFYARSVDTFWGDDYSEYGSGDLYNVDNFGTGGNDLDALTDFSTDYSAGNIETQDFTSLAGDKTFLAGSDDDKQKS